MSSKVVGEGTYGCVLKPPLKCITDNSTKNLDYNNKVSKIMHDNEAKNEVKEYININSIKGLNKYAITGPIYCKPLVDENFRKSVTKCKNKTVKTELKKLKPKLGMLLHEDGGINISDFIIDVFSKQTLNEQKIFLTSLINLIDGLDFFRKNDILHRDIKLQNMVYNINNGKSKYIDFGLMTKGEILRQNAKNNAERLGVSWAYFPPENSCTNKGIFDYNIKCLALKDQFKTHDKFIDFVIISFDIYCLSTALFDLGFALERTNINRDFVNNFQYLFGSYSVPSTLYRKTNIIELKKQYIELLKKHKYYLKKTPTPSPLVKEIVKKIEKEELKKVDEKICPPNKPYYNEKTKKCNKYLPKNKTSKKICPPDKPYLNPKSNRCVKVLPKNKTSKKICPPDKPYFNEKTKRCVKGLPKNNTYKIEYLYNALNKSLNDEDDPEKFRTILINFLNNTTKTDMQKYNTYDNVQKLIDIWHMTVTDEETNDEIWNDAQENDIDLDFSNKLPVIFIKKLMLIKEKNPKENKIMVEFATNSEMSSLSLSLLGKFDKNLPAIVLERYASPEKK